MKLSALILPPPEAGGAKGASPLLLSGARSRAERGGILFKLLVLLMLLAVSGVVYLLRHPLLRAAGNFWVVDDGPQRADAILVLGDDNYLAERAGRAAELYRAGWAPRIVASGIYLRPYLSAPDLMQRDLVERGVPAAAVFRFAHHAGNTREEADALRQLMQQQHWRRALVVTSNYHTRRSRYIFRRVFGPDIELRVLGARDSGYDPDNWWKSRAEVKLFFREVLAFCVAVWEMRSTDPGRAAALSGGLLPSLP